jgi:hypothetical protein
MEEKKIIFFKERKTGQGENDDTKF